MPKEKEKEEIIKTTIRLPRPLWKALRFRAVEEDTTGEALVIKALEAYLRKGGSR